MPFVIILGWASSIVRYALYSDRVGQSPSDAIGEQRQFEPLAGEEARVALSEQSGLRRAPVVRNISG